MVLSRNSRRSRRRPAGRPAQQGAARPAAAQRAAGGSVLLLWVVGPAPTSCSYARRTLWPLVGDSRKQLLQ